LVERIVRGALEGDPVRLHGAIFAALEIHGPTDARRHVFGRALGAVRMSCTDCEAAAAAAIRDHLAAPQWSVSSPAA
jgi:hypothetical protein